MLELEDTHADVLRKAMVGLKMPVDIAASRAGIDSKRVRRLLDEASDREAIEKLAPVLNLSPKALLGLAEKSWYPEVSSLDGLIVVSTPFRGGQVNAFIIHDDQTRAVVFDTGTSADPIIQAAEEAGVQVDAIVITHAHKDHVMGLKDLRSRWSVPVHAVDDVRVPGAQKLQYGQRLEVGGLQLNVLKTVGHAADGASLLIEGIGAPTVIVGDALFAGSMGGGMMSYSQALETTSRELMSLDPETVVCPGHGPLTTIGQERVHNAFFGK